MLNPKWLEVENGLVSDIWIAIEVLYFSLFVICWIDKIQKRLFVSSWSQKQHFQIMQGSASVQVKYCVNSSQDKLEG